MSISFNVFIPSMKLLSSINFASIYFYRKLDFNVQTGSFPKSNWKIVGTGANSIPLTHVYMSTHFLGLIQVQYKVARLN